MSDGYTEADRRMVADVHHRLTCQGCVSGRGGCAGVDEADEEYADASLAALAGAGRLLPEDTRTEYGVRWHDTSVVVDGYVRETAVAVGAQYEHAEAVQRRVGPWVPVPAPVVGAGMDVAGTPTAGAQTYATDTQTGPAGVPEEKTR